MTDFSLVPVDYQPDFSDFSFVPVNYDPFGADGAIHQAQALAESQPQQPATEIGQPNVGAPASNAQAAAPGESYDPDSESAIGAPASGQPYDPSATPISPPGVQVLLNQQQPGEMSGLGPASIGDSSSFWKSLLQGTINATVPGAYHSGLAQQQFRKGNYGAAALYGVESLADAALGAATLGAATRLGTAARAAVPNTVETASSNVLYKLESYLLDPDHTRGGGPKADWFKRALGFTQENAADLEKQLVFDKTQAIQTGVTQYGKMFNQTINVTGANGRTIPVRTTWRIGPDDVPRFITAVPRS